MPCARQTSGMRLGKVYIETKGYIVHLTSWLSAVASKFGRFNLRKHSKAKLSKVDRAGAAEQLEARELLTVTASVVQNELIVQAGVGDSVAIRSGIGTPARVDVFGNGVRLTTLGNIAASSLSAIRITGGDGANAIDLSAVTSTVFNPTVRLIVDAGNGNDTITCSTDIACSVLGGDGADTINGGTRNDTLDGGNGDDSLLGTSGDDVLRGGDGRDLLDGGLGNDSVDGGDGKDSVLGGIGNDTLNGGSDTDDVRGGVGNDVISGGSGNDTLLGEDGNDTVLGGSNDDSILGGTGNDSLGGESGNDTVLGEAGDDSLDGGTDRNSLLGGTGNDFIVGGIGADTAIGNSGNDTIYAGGGNDLLFGDESSGLGTGTGSDLVKGNAGNDTIDGGGGRDTLMGDAGDDLVRGGDIDSDNQPIVSLSGGTAISEGNAGTTTVTVNISLQRAFTTSVSVLLTTVDGSATAGSDYVAVSQTLVFTPGQTSRSVSVLVNGDTVNESDETFFVTLGSVTGGQLGSSVAQFIIRNDDLWTAMGPGPLLNGQVENISPNNEVIGAVHTVVAHPTNPDILYAGATNGGIWRTTNATSASPNWTPLTDNLSSQSIGALTMDPADSNRLLAGIGRFSSFGLTGSVRDGLLLTDDGGATWRQIQDPLLLGRNFSGVVLQGNLMVASANFFAGGGGVYRSTDNGNTWSFVSGTGGLSLGAASDLVADTAVPGRLYASVTGVGIFRSNDGGATWVNISANDVSQGGANARITAAGNNNIEMAVGRNGRLYIGVLTNGQPSYIGYTDDGTAWTRMDLPTTLEGNGDVEGLSPRTNPGGQGAIHFSIVVDPTDQNIVYVAGDRQDGPFPNFLGAVAFSGRIFRGDTRIAPTGATPSPQWAHMTHRNDIAAIPTGGTASSSSPHADSREMTFDAAGNLIETDDGGIYRRTSPRTNTGDWFSINGNLQINEMHDVAYDTTSNIIIGGSQDTGTPQQITSVGQAWDSVSQADGGDVAVDIISIPGQSIRYSSFQNLGAFRRRTYDANNNLLSEVFPPLTVTGNGAAFVPQFVTPVAVNAVDGQRIILGGGNNPYESANRGNSITELANVGPVNSDAIAYGGFLGGVPNPDVLYVGSGNQIFVRQAGTGAPARAASYPGGFVTGIALDPANWRIAYVSDSTSVFRTTDAGATWADVTGNLAQQGIQAIEFINGVGSFVAVGTQVGVYRMSVATLGTWSELDASLPTVPVYDLDYDSRDDLIVAGTLGRGAWMFRSASVVQVATSTPLPPVAAGVSAGDLIQGGTGNDTLIGADGMDTILGDDGDDSLLGSGGDDTITTGSGNDTTDGGSGDDTINGERGNHTLGGGADSNTITLRPFANGTSTGGNSSLATNGADTVIIEGNAGNNTFTVSQVGSQLRITTGTASITLADSVRTVNIVAGDGDDTITLTDVNRTLPVAITLDLGAGNDRFIGSNAKLGVVPLQVLGGTGNDTLDGTSGTDIFDGGDGNDVINGSDGVDTLRGGIGDDTIGGGTGDDSLLGDDGADSLNGDDGNDIVLGGTGNDVLNGWFGNDTIKGENGNDTVFGAAGNDRIEGGTGADSVRGHAGFDLILGGDGNDTLRGDQDNDTINAGDGEDDVDGGDGNDLIAGANGNDTLLGGNGNDTLIGGDGNDLITGAAGNDTILAGDGDDTVAGNGGTNKVSGGDGTDVLSVNSPSEIDEAFVLDAAILALLTPV